MGEKVRDPNNVQIGFVNQVLGQGHANGVINLTLGVALFTPKIPDEGQPPDTGGVDVDMIVAARLRMDLACAVQLRDSLDAILKKVLPEAGTVLQ